VSGFAAAFRRIGSALAITRQIRSSATRAAREFLHWLDARQEIPDRNQSSQRPSARERFPLVSARNREIWDLALLFPVSCYCRERPLLRERNAHLSPNFFASE
jgi:hypothetical protein